MKNSKVGTVMHEFKVGKLKSSSGQKVTNRKQAVAIAMSEAGKKMKKYVRGGDIPDGDVQSNRNIGKRDPSLNKRKSTAPFTMDEMKGGLSTEELNKKSRPFDKAKEGKYAAGGRVKKMAFGGQTSAPRPTNPFTNPQQYAAEQAAMKPSVVKGNKLPYEAVMQKISPAGGKPPYAGPRPGMYGAPKGGSEVSPGIMQGIEKRAIDKISTPRPTTSAPTTYKYVNGKAVPVGMKRGGKVKKMAFGGQTSASPRPTTSAPTTSTTSAPPRPPVVAPPSPPPKYMTVGGKQYLVGVDGKPRQDPRRPQDYYEPMIAPVTPKIPPRPPVVAPPASAPTTPVGMKRGGKVGESKKMVKKEVEFFKKKKAPKAMIKHEMGEAKGMKRGGGKVMKFAKGGSIDGCALHGKTKLPRGY